MDNMYNDCPQYRRNTDDWIRLLYVKYGIWMLGDYEQKFGIPLTKTLARPDPPNEWKHWTNVGTNESAQLILSPAQSSFVKQDPPPDQLWLCGTDDDGLFQLDSDEHNQRPRYNGNSLIIF